MGIDPTIWGPNAWTFIHLMVLSEKESFDTSRLVHYEQLFELLKHLLPCESCRQHLSENLNTMESLKSITSKRALFDWTIMLHNKVNRTLNKKEWNLEDAYNHWESVSLGKRSYAGQYCRTNYWKYISLSIILVIIILVIRGSTISKRFRFQR